MVKKTITYTDYNGNERTEDHWFNLSNAELIEMDLGTSGGLGEYLKQIVASQDGPSIMANFKNILMKSYGIKHLDGKRFEKSPEISEAFIQTEAYSVLLMELLSDADAAAKFISKIVPPVPEDHKASALPLNK